MPINKYTSNHLLKIIFFKTKDGKILLDVNNLIHCYVNTLTYAKRHRDKQTHPHTCIHTHTNI